MTLEDRVAKLEQENERLTETIRTLVLTYQRESGIVNSFNQAVLALVQAHPMSNKFAIALTENLASTEEMVTRLCISPEHIEGTQAAQQMLLAALDESCAAQSHLGQSIH